MSGAQPPGSATAASVSVVMPTYNRRDLLPKAVPPLLAQSSVDEIVVVVDGSTDGSQELVAEMAREQERLKLVAIPNAGAAVARLEGVRAASGDVVLILDDDVIAEPELARGHAAHHRDGARRVVVGYMPVWPPRKRCSSFPRDLYSREYERSAREWEANPASIFPGFWAGNVSMRRAHYLELSPALKGIPRVYHEDLDFGLCCLEAGFEAVFDRSLRARHCYERSVEGFLRDARSSALALGVLAERHPESREPPSPDLPLQGIPRVDAAVVRLGARSAALRWGVRSAASFSAACGACRPARRAGNLAWRIEQLRLFSEGR